MSRVVEPALLAAGQTGCGFPSGAVLTSLRPQDAQTEGEGGAFVGGGMMVERPARWMPPERLVGLVVLANRDLEWTVGWHGVAP